MGLVFFTGGVLLMSLVCGEEINTFGPLHSIVSRCIALHCIERAGAAIMVTHTVCLSLQYWSLTRDVCSLMHVCDLCLFYCVCVCLVWIALWSQCSVTILKHTWHDTNNTHLLPCVLCAQYCTSRSQFWAEMLTTVQLLLPQPWQHWVEPWEILTTQISLLMRHFGQDFSS